ncbi:MAG: TatD family hydrolase [Clostridia bacterium]|nr:TatD family hydrolase [Clostridia bacterium]
MSWFDTHAHVADDAFDGDRDAVLARAWEAGLSGIVVVGTDADSSRRALSLARATPGLWATVGLHPHAAASRLGDLDEIASLAEEGAVAVGEIGLDYHRGRETQKEQRRALEAQLELASRLRLPVVLHVRDAADDMIAVLRGVALPAGGVWHAFTGFWPEAEAALAAGLHIGLGGILTFPRSEELRKVARRLPLDRVVLETDSPYLAPVPYRGRRNEPAYVVEVGRCLARLLGLSPDEVERRTTANALALFRLAAGER